MLQVQRSACGDNGADFERTRKQVEPIWMGRNGLPTSLKQARRDEELRRDFVAELLDR